MSKLEPTYTFRLRVLVIRENDTWIAQGLDYDITGHGKEVSGAVENLLQTLIGQILIDAQHGEVPLRNTQPAPKFYWNKFRTSRFTEKREKLFSIPEVLPAYMIEAVDVRLAA